MCETETSGEEGVSEAALSMMPLPTVENESGMPDQKL